MHELPPDPAWHHDAIIYQLHVKAFRDSNRDGYGDFRGLLEKLDYIASLGGPPVPTVGRGDVHEGFKGFRDHCAGCHSITARGGVAPPGAAPALQQATATQIAEAVRVGPYLMPRFDERQIDDAQLNSIVAYVLAQRHPDDHGGWGIGNIGPIPEGLVAWLLAGTALLIVARLIGERA